MIGHRGRGQLTSRAQVTRHHRSHLSRQAHRLPILASLCSILHIYYLLTLLWNKLFFFKKHYSLQFYGTQSNIFPTIFLNRENLQNKVYSWIELKNFLGEIMNFIIMFIYINFLVRDEFMVTLWFSKNCMFCVFCLILL